MVALRRVLPPASAGLLALLLAPGPAASQPPPAGGPETKKDAKPDKEAPPFTLQTDRASIAKLEAAADYLEGEDWVAGTPILQRLLEGDDVLLPPRPCYFCFC